MNPGYRTTDGYLYFAIVAIALYSDLLKRVLDPTSALIAGYAFFVLIIAACARKISNSKTTYFRSARFSTVCFALAVVYLIQLLTNVEAPLFEACSSALYLVLPLAYIVAIARGFPQFDLARLGQWFLLLMPPVLAVALVQYFVDSSFLVDTTYSETGGVIARNFIDNDITVGETYYNRLPSIFASADRLSAMGMMYFYFCVLLCASSKMTRMRALWLLFSFVSAMAVLMISGSRSRILVICIAIVMAGFPVALRLIGGVNHRLGSAGRSGVMILIVSALGGGAAVLTMTDRIDSLPLIRQLTATLENGDIWIRIMEFLDVSSMPDDFTFFGLGLGTAGTGGRPGEFAVRAMWIESGIFWTLLMLTLYSALAFRLAECLAAAIRQQAGFVGIFLCAVPLFMWLFGLMAGLTSIFELSTALTLFPAIAVITTGVVLPERGPIRSVAARGNGRTFDGSGRTL